MNEYGTAGGSLGASRNSGHGEWASSAGAAKSGRVGEIEVAGLLRETFARFPDVHVFHDLRLPGYSANIDHAVVAGSRVLLLDSKRWRPGFYWTLAGRTRRGRERIEWADGATMPAAVRVVTQMIDKAATSNRALAKVKVAASLVVVPAGDGKLSMWAYRPSGGTQVKVAGSHTPRWLRAQVRSVGVADPALVSLLRTLVIDQAAFRPHGQVAPPARR